MDFFVDWIWSQIQEAKNMFFEATSTFVHQNLISSSISPSEYLYQIWGNTLKTFSKYFVCGNGTDGQTYGRITRKT